MCKLKTRSILPAWKELIKLSLYTWKVVSNANLGLKAALTLCSSGSLDTIVSDSTAVFVEVHANWTQPPAPGTFQQYTLAPASYVTPIPEGLKSEDAAPMLCAGVTTWVEPQPQLAAKGAAYCTGADSDFRYSALRKSGAASGQWVVIGISPYTIINRSLLTCEQRVLVVDLYAAPYFSASIY